MTNCQGIRMKKLIHCILLAIYSIACYSSNHQATNTSPPIRASFYAQRFEGRLMANGQRFHSNVVSAASLEFPLGTKVRVRNVKTGKTVLMTITDRGPSSKRFKIDLSSAAFQALGFFPKQGWGWVTVEKVTE